MIQNKPVNGSIVYGSYARDLNQGYALELDYRNAADLADWLLEHGLTTEQHANLMDMLYSNDKESQWLALELIKTKKKQLTKPKHYEPEQ